MKRQLPHDLVIFDWDGTLMDSQAKIVFCMQRAAEHVCLPVLHDQPIRNIIGLGLPEALKALYPQITPAESDAMREQYSHFFVNDKSVASQLFDNVGELLILLQNQGRRLAIATGKSRKGLDRVLSEVGLLGCFDATRCADETASKPSPLMVDEILRELDVPAGQAIMVGDTEYDLAMAQAAGVASIGVTFGSHSREQLLRHDPLSVVDNVLELMDSF